MAPRHLFNEKIQKSQLIYARDQRPYTFVLIKYLVLFEWSLKVWITHGGTLCQMILSIVMTCNVFVLTRDPTKEKTVLYSGTRQSYL